MKIFFQKKHEHKDAGDLLEFCLEDKTLAGVLLEFCFKAKLSAGWRFASTPARIKQVFLVICWRLAGDLLGK